MTEIESSLLIEQLTQRIESLEKMIGEMYEMFKEFRPMITKYQAVQAAGSLLAKRRELKK